MSDEKARREKFMKERTAHLEKLGKRDIGQNIFIDCEAINTEDVWVACRLIDSANGDIFKAVWDILGLFDDEEKAVEVCKTPMDFVGPLTLNKFYGDGRVEWKGGYYPWTEPIEGQDDDKN